MVSLPAGGSPNPNPNTNHIPLFHDFFEHHPMNGHDLQMPTGSRWKDKKKKKVQ